MARREVEFGDYELDRANRRLVIGVGGAKAMRLTATLASGVWASRVLEVKKRLARGASESFSTPRTIAAGGGAALDFTEEDLAGIAELEFSATGAVENGLLRISGSIEYDAVSVAPAVVPGIGIGPGAGGTESQSMPGQPEEV